MMSRMLTYGYGRAGAGTFENEEIMSCTPQMGGKVQLRNNDRTRTASWALVDMHDLSGEWLLHALNPIKEGARRERLQVQ